MCREENSVNLLAKLKLKINASVIIVAFYLLFRYICLMISEICKIMNKDYESPLIEILEVEVEKGYLGSIPSYDEEDFNWDYF